MKKLLMVIIAILIIGLTTILIIGIVTRRNKSSIAKDRIRTLPVFSMKTLNGSVFYSGQIKEGPVLVLFFHPECEHCQYEITTLFKNWTETSGIHVLIISNAEKEAIRIFFKQNNISKYGGITVLIDEAYSFGDLFGTQLVPATFIYDKQLKLVKYFQGEVSPETILKYLRQDD